MESLEKRLLLAVEFVSFDIINDHTLDGIANVDLSIKNTGLAGTFSVDFIWSHDEVFGNGDDILADTLLINLQADEIFEDLVSLQLDKAILYTRAIMEAPPGMAGTVSTEVDFLRAEVDQIFSNTDDFAYFPFDIDDDGVVTTTDAIFVINRLGQTVPPADSLADFDGNGLVTPIDATSVINRLGYLINDVMEEPLPTDPLFPDFWHLLNTGQSGGTPGIDINIVPAWDITTGDPSLTIAVIDSGFYPTNEEISSVFIEGFDFSDGDEDVTGIRQHGTRTVANLAGVHDNDFGGAGVLKDVQILPLRIGEDLVPTNTQFLVDAIESLAGTGVDIANMSLISDFSTDIENAILSLPNVTFVSAAGNESNDNDIFPTYPSSFDADNIISVAAIDHNGNLGSFSNFGYNTVDIAAPGVDTMTYDGSISSGTSNSTAFVTGVVGLVKTIRPEWSPSQIRDVLMETSRPLASLEGLVFSGGLIDAYAAVRMASGFDNEPPSISSVSTAADGFRPQIVLHFDETIVLSSLDVSIDGGVPIHSIQRIGLRDYAVTLHDGLASGDYTINVNTAVDLSGNVMASSFEETVTLSTGVARFDFDAPGSPTEEGFTSVHENLNFTTETGYGWIPVSLTRGADREVGDDTRRDLNGTNNGTFSISVPNGTYRLNTVVGDALFAHAGQQFVLEGIFVDSLSTAPGQFFEREYVTNVVDGQIDLRLLNGLGQFTILNSLVVTRL